MKNQKDPQFYSEAIVQALQEHILTLESSIRVHRVTIGRLRKMNSELRRLKNIQIQNDQEFESMCFDIDTDMLGAGGLPISTAS